MIVAQPFDASQIPAIERAIRKSDVGLNPSSDGKVIRIPVPPLTEERRKEIVKKAHDLAEHARNAVRQARREGNDKLKKMEKDKAISQDDERRGLDEVQKLHDHYIAEVSSALQKKEQQIMEV
jgi:ribosome recycling factor